MAPIASSSAETGDTFRGSSGSMGGEALGQGKNTGRFNSASVFGSSLLIPAIDGVCHAIPRAFSKLAEVSTANLDGTVSGTQNTNDPNGTGTQSPDHLHGRISYGGCDWPGYVDVL